MKSSILKAYLKEDILKINFPLFMVLISQEINQYFRSELTWHEEKREGYHLPFGLTLKDNFSIFPSLLRALSPQHLLNFVSGYSKMHLSVKYLLCPPDHSLPQILTITPPRQKKIAHFLQATFFWTSVSAEEKGGEETARVDGSDWQGKYGRVFHWSHFENGSNMETTFILSGHCHINPSALLLKMVSDSYADKPVARTQI